MHTNQGRRARLTRGAMLLAAALALSACDVELYGDLTQQDANEMVAALAAAGVSASREKSPDGAYSVQVDESNFSVAVAALERRGLPRQQFQTLCTVFGEDGGWAPSPTRESARMACALGQELSRSVSEIDGVARARVHLALPSVDMLSRERAEATASVAVHYHPDFDTASLTPRIKLLVANGVEGLEYERVSVALFPAVDSVPQTAPAAPAASPAVARRTAAETAPSQGYGGVILAAAVLAALAALAYGMFSRLMGGRGAQERSRS